MREGKEEAARDERAVIEAFKSKEAKSLELSSTSYLISSSSSVN